MLDGLRRLVDPRIQSVWVADVRAYLQRRGWVQRLAPRLQQLAFEEPAGIPDGQAIVYLPSSEQFADYPQRVLEVITELADIEDRYSIDVLNDILGGPTGAGSNATAKPEQPPAPAEPR
jgi:hypothetical protein